MKAFVKLAMLAIIAGAMYPAVAHATNIQTVRCGIGQVYVVTSTNLPMLVIACAPNPNTPPYYAYPLLSTNAPIFQAFMTLITAQASANQITAHANNWTNALLITVDMDDTSGNNWGCGAANCRTILNIETF